jgi:hypothetical protein
LAASERASRCRYSFARRSRSSRTPSGESLRARSTAARAWSEPSSDQSVVTWVADQ